MRPRAFIVWGIVGVRVLAQDETEARAIAAKRFDMDPRSVEEEKPAVCMAQVPGEGQNLCTLDKGHLGAHRCKACDVDQRRRGQRVSA